ncbi:hypothetical protein BDV96DRAFT_654086 [Lophiotrema nucula]|uniref:Tubby C-terminal-like domain-containing protein n=1 Tax=Lophiotrema nucula TaxID=690887 RepID=A0A6A5YJ55_9PLEO|nr:hypothetical protein BDV96DRAFT_654086 [Lophiotrema nucula]
MSTTTLTVDEKALAPAIPLAQISGPDRKELILADTVSITSGTTIAPLDAGFVASKSLHINAKGVPVLRLPLAPTQLETSIHNADGSVAYLSTREKQSSGNCVLSDAEGKQLISTSYFFGPGRDPVLHYMEDGGGEGKQIRTLSRWTSRTQRFVLPDGREFTWAYRKEKGFGGENKKGTALVMTLAGKRMAVLVRNEETRTPGSKSCSAGNGGELVLGDTVGTAEGMGEDVVVATCLLMLKKEIDRRRTVQFMMISAAVSA